MTTDKTSATLATVKHGGCVQLGSEERVRFDAWLETISVDTTRWGDGEYADPYADNYWLAWQAALAAQPSPGGQDALATLQQDYDKLLASFNRQVETAEKIAGRVLQQDDRIEELEAALAARQPVYVQGCDELRARTEGERAAYMEGLEEGKKIAARQPVAYRSRYIESDRVGTWMYHREHPTHESDVEVQSLYAAPPAQAVDLGQFREAVAYAARSADFATHVEIGSKLRELLALIDSQVVGNG